MKKTSGIGKTLRTSITELQALDVSETDLARVGGGLTRIGGGVIGGGGGGTVYEDHCWQASASVTNPGDPDNDQDWVID